MDKLLYHEKLIERFNRLLDSTEGKEFSRENEIIASDALKEDGFKIEDILHLSSTEEELRIVGFTDKARFNAASVLYGDLEMFHRVKFGEAAEANNDRINEIVVRAEELDSIGKKGGIEVVEIETFIRNLPSYTEQSLTLNFMIYFLFIITAVIVAIFLYVLTVQKISMFGVMKAQGISNRYLANSVIAHSCNRCIDWLGHDSTDRCFSTKCCSCII